MTEASSHAFDRQHKPGHFHTDYDNGPHLSSHTLLWLPDGRPGTFWLDILYHQLLFPVPSIDWILDEILWRRSVTVCGRRILGPGSGYVNEVQTSYEWLTNPEADERIDTLTSLQVQLSLPTREWFAFQLFLSVHAMPAVESAYGVTLLCEARAISIANPHSSWLCPGIWASESSCTMSRCSIWLQWQHFHAWSYRFTAGLMPSFYLRIYLCYSHHSSKPIVESTNALCVLETVNILTEWSSCHFNGSIHQCSLSLTTTLTSPLLPSCSLICRLRY